MESVNTWFVELVIGTINRSISPEDKMEVSNWFHSIKNVLDDNISKKDKIKEVYSRTQASRVVTLLFNSLIESCKNYARSDLPTPLKVALPVGLAGLSILGSQGMGVAAFGGAIGAPLVLVIFIGSAGITSIVEGISKSVVKQELASLLSIIAYNEVIRRKEKKLRQALGDDLTTPNRAEFTLEHDTIKNELMAMDPYDFERHIMSFFPKDSGVTPRSNDYGIDGWCKYKNKLILVQCKRYSETNKVSRPEVQAFKGAIGDKMGDMGFLVTTSTFTNGAAESARKSQNLKLIDINKLIKWHFNGFTELD
ncbi:MAG: restriction endonuclease [Oligoflexales bacterium]